MSRNRPKHPWENNENPRNPLGEIGDLNKFLEDDEEELIKEEPKNKSKSSIKPIKKEKQIQNDKAFNQLVSILSSGMPSKYGLNLTNESKNSLAKIYARFSINCGYTPSKMFILNKSIEVLSYMMEKWDDDLQPFYEKCKTKNNKKDIDFIIETFFEEKLKD